MGTAKKVVSLVVRPLQASHLCFEVGGVLQELNTELGAAVTPLNFAKLYTELSSFPPVVSGSLPTLRIDYSRLLWDSKYLVDAVRPYTLANLRAEAGKAALNQEINARQNAYFAKYADAPAIISRMNALYSPSSPGSKSIRLDTLRTLAQDQADALRTAYEGDSLTNVVKHTKSRLRSKSHIDESDNSATEDIQFAAEVGPISAQISPLTLIGI